MQIILYIFLLLVKNSPKYPKNKTQPHLNEAGLMFHLTRDIWFARVYAC